VEKISSKGLTNIPSSDMTVSWLESFYISSQHFVHVNEVPHVLRHPGRFNIDLIYTKHRNPTPSFSTEKRHNQH
jgi:hypothetical protein